MKKIILTLVFMLFATRVYAGEINFLSAEDSFLKLKQGNEHFVQMHLKHPHTTKQRRTELTKAQHPFAVILTCSDSRVPAELIFDQGLGDIFVIKNAGNVLDEHVVGSIEYAVEHLGVKLIVIMGHESCGAVGATIQDTKGSQYIESIKKSICPALIEAKKENNASAENVSKINAKLGVENVLKLSQEMQEATCKNCVKIIPAYYHLDSGRVEFLNN